MNAQRAQAYRRVIDLLDDPAAMLLEPELEAVRAAADTFIFAQTLNEEVVTAMTTVLRITRDLVESGRWPEEHRAQLLHDAAACAPVPAGGRDLKLATRALSWPDYEWR